MIRFCGETVGDDRNTLIVCAIAVGGYLGLGVVVYTHFEGWSVLQAVYFSVVVLTTVGYGDLAPSTQASKLFTCFFALLGIGLIGAALGVVGGALLERQEKLVEDLAVEAADQACTQSVTCTYLV